MSWKAYIEEQLLATGAISEACILSVEDGAVWSAVPDTFIPRAYLASLKDEAGNPLPEQLVNEAQDLAALARTLTSKAGLRINQVKYTIVRTMPNGVADDGLKTIYFKSNAQGGCLAVTTQAIIIGLYDTAKGHSPPNCFGAVENLARYLKSNGF